MKKYILPAFCSLLLSLPSQAQKNGQAIPAPTAEYYMNHYQFDEAEELLNQDIKKLKRNRAISCNFPSSTSVGCRLRLSVLISGVMSSYATSNW